MILKKEIDHALGLYRNMFTYEHYSQTNLLVALDHSIISPLWVRASHGARVTCGTSQVLLAGVSGGFSPGTPVFAPPTD